jgi:hypothetical protein
MRLLVTIYNIRKESGLVFITPGGNKNMALLLSIAVKYHCHAGENAVIIKP